MKTLLYFALGSALLGIGWIVICYGVSAWKRRAAVLAALYG